MSFMQQIERLSDGHYVLPKIGEMSTDVHAFLSEQLFAQTNDEL